MSDLKTMRALEEAGFVYPEPWGKYNKCVSFLQDLIRPLKDRDDYFQAWQSEAENLLKEIGEFEE